MTTLYFINKENTDSEKNIRGILGEYLGVNGNGLVICMNEYGKPYLRDFPNVHFNISHKTGVFICALSDNPVGVDIEVIKDFNKRIAERFFTKNEQEYIFVNTHNQNERFAEIWTRKEAYVKFIGKGMAIPFESIDVLKLETANIISTFYMGRYVLSICNLKQSIYNERLII